MYLYGLLVYVLVVTLFFLALFLFDVYKMTENSKEAKYIPVWKRLFSSLGGGEVESLGGEELIGVMLLSLMGAFAWPVTILFLSVPIFYLWRIRDS